MKYPTALSRSGVWAVVLTLGAVLGAHAAENYLAIVGPVTVDTRRPDLTVPVAALDTPLEALAASTQPLAWTVLNQGAAPAIANWVDRVYLSTDATLGSDRLVGEFPATGPLATNQSLSRAQNIALPADLELDRDYWWIVIADDDNALDEANEANNAGVSDQPMRLVRSPMPNLRVVAVSASIDPMSGQPATVSWAVTNAGTWTTGAGLWQEAVYLADRPELDTSAVLLGRVRGTRPLGTNESYAGSLTATVPQALSGTRHFIVQVDADNRVNEGFGENDNVTASAPVAIGLTPPPDLQVATIQSPANAVSGASLALSWTVTNAGPGPTVTLDWSDDLYLSPTPAFGTNALFLGSMPHTGALTNGAAYTASAAFVVPPSLSGSFHLLVHTDARNDVFEHSFDTNNVGASPAPIVIALSPPPDLAVTAVAAPATALASHPVTVSTVVTNQGTDTLFQLFWEDRLYLSVDAVLDGMDAVLASQWHWGGLLAGERYTNTFAASLPHELSGSWYAIAETDAANAVFELDETNNVLASATPIQVDSRPADLVVTSLAAPSTAQAGSSLLVSWTVRNSGTGDTVASRWADGVVLSADATPGNGDDVPLLTLERNALLEPGASYTVADRVVSIPFAAVPGTYRLFLLTDIDNAVYEGGGEGNNASTPRTIAITRTTADLRMTAVSLAPLEGEGQGEGGLEVYSEDTIIVAWRVENAGAASPNSAVWADAVYLSTNAVWSTNSILLGVNQNPATLDPGAFYTNTLVVTLPAEIQGSFFVHVLADAAGEVVEDNNANNLGVATNTLSVTLRPVPDLAVLSVTSPADGFSGQEFELSWTVTNSGPVSAEGTWYDSVYLSLDPQFEPDLDTHIGYAERPTTLTTGQSYTQSATLRVPPDVSGLLHVFVVCDSTQRLNERGATANNVGAAPKPVAVWIRPPADLVVGTITIPTNAVSGYEMALTYVLRNQGTNAAFGPWADALYLSADDQWDIGDALFARVSQTGLLAVGGSRTNTVSAPAPGVVPGDYRVIIRTDVVNQVPETNEFNNVTGTLEQVASEVDALELGVPAANSLANRQARYYRVHVTAGQWLVVQLDCASATAATELFVRYGAIPTRTDFDFIHSNPLQPNHRIIVPNTQEGDYYILVYGDFIAAPGSADMALLARLSQFLVLDTSFGRGGNAGNLTIPITGADLDRTCTARLTNTTGLDRPAVSHYYDSSTRFYATLDLLDLVPGLYTVVVEKSNAAPVTIPDSLEVVACGPLPPVVPVVTAPSVMRWNVAYTFTVQWANTGLNDAPAPLLTVGNTVPFSVAPGDYSLGTRYTFLGINTQGGPPGVLRPGQTEMMTFHSVSGIEAGDYTAFADRAGKNVGDAMDWNRVLHNLPNDDLMRPHFSAIWTHFTNQIGLTWGHYLNMLARNATLLPAGMGDNRSAPDLERLEWQKALAAQTLSLSGQVTSDSVAVDLGNLQVVASPTNGPQSVTAWSLTDGMFFMPDVPADLCLLEVRGGHGRLASPMLVDTRGGQSHTNVSLSLRTGARLQLQVTDASARAVPEAWITVGSAANPAAIAVTDESGMAIVAALPSGFHDVYVQAQQFAPYSGSVILSEQQSRLESIRLTTGIKISALVSLPTGEPLANALVFIQDTALPRRRNFTTTDASGLFVFQKVASGSYAITVAARNAESYTATIEVVEPSDVDLGQLVLRRRGAPAGGVRLMDENPTTGDPELDSILRNIEASLRAFLLPALDAWFGKDVANLWKAYLDGSPQHPMLPQGPFVDPGMIARSFKPYLDGYFERVLAISRNSVVSAFGDGRLKWPCNEDCMVDTTSLLKEPVERYVSPAELQPRIWFANPFNIPGNIAGGQGATDSRRITGNVLIRGWGAYENIRSVGIRSRLACIVEDQIDFTPGDSDLGSFMEQSVTTWLQILQQAGWAHPVSYRVVLVDTDSRRRNIGYVGRYQTDGEECRQKDCDPCKQPNPPDSCDDTDRPVSYDPNDIVGPGGFGHEYWISPDQTLHYTVRFENDAKKAVAAAQYVRISHPLSKNLDLRTFRLGVMGFGTNLVEVPMERTFYQTRLDLHDTLGVVLDITASLDLERGEVTWEFFSLDPETGDFPFNPFLGFLPPNTDGIIGQGFVTYTIKPKSGIAQGVVVNAEARIFFDYSEPIDTPRIFNTLDTGLPSSTVLPLPLTTNRNVFPVQWAGADSYGGAGVGGFDIYVSENGGPWQLWLANTPYWERLFVGECGHSYAFYSAARDNVGHLENAAPAAQALIRVLPNTSPVLEAIANRFVAVGQPLRITNVVSDADPGQQVTFSLGSGTPQGMQIDPLTGLLTWRPTCVQGGRVHAVTVGATDDGCGELSSTRTFTVAVTECLQVSLGRTVTAVGSSGCLPVNLESGYSLTNLAFTVEVPPGRFAEFSVAATAPEVASADAVWTSPSEVLVTLGAKPSQTLRGPGSFADLCFALALEQDSAFVWPAVKDVLGLRADGAQFGNNAGGAGRVAIVGRAPLLDAVLDKGGQPELIVHGEVGSSIALERTSALGASPLWAPAGQVAMTNLSQAVPCDGVSNPAGFYRARRW